MSHSISRASFLKSTASTGLLLSVPGLLSSCSSLEHRFAKSESNDPLSVARQLGHKQPIMAALLCGITAPNPHNVQPWLFKIESPTAAQLFVDASRLLPHTDPPARQVHIGQGTLLEHVRLGALNMGYQAQINILPQGNYIATRPDKPVAAIQLKKLDKPRVADIDHKLYQAMANRATHRGVYKDARLTEWELQSLSQLCQPQYCKLKIIHQSEDLKRLNALFFAAMQTECNLPRTYDESREWFRYNDEEIYQKRDGISLRGNDMSGMKLWLVSQFLGRSKADWHDPSNINIYLDGFKDTLDSNAAVAYLQTRSNSLSDWIRVGQDYARLHLAAEYLGLKMQPLSQILQEFPEMDRLRQEFHKLNQVSSPGRIQMVVRLGKAHDPFKSPRRALDSMLKKNGTA